MIVQYSNWCLSNNFGDSLNKYIIEKVTGLPCIYSDKNSELKKIVCTGSILNWPIRNAQFWGCGFANINDTITAEGFTIHGVRGHYTAHKSGYAGNIIGDGSLILPYIYKPDVEKKYKFGILPHYVDLDIVYLNWYEQEDVIVIDPLQEVEKVVEQICSCEEIYSSSLHGLIVPFAYGIPIKWCKFSDRILGDDTKFFDFFTTISEFKTCRLIDLRTGFTKESFTGAAKHEFTEDIVKLILSFPMKQKPTWDILICTIPKRAEMFDRIFTELQKQIMESGLQEYVSIRFDNSEEGTIGQKRNNLMQSSQEDYISFVDDDDMVSSDYVKEQYLHIATTNPDCLSLQGIITTDGVNPKKFVHSLKYTTYFEKEKVYYRCPNHLNVIKREIAVQIGFTDKNHGEDTDFAMALCKSGLIKKEVWIDKIMYNYLFVSKK